MYPGTTTKNSSELAPLHLLSSQKQLSSNYPEHPSNCTATPLQPSPTS